MSVSVFCLRILSLCALASRWRLKEGLGTSFILILCKHKFKLGDLFMKTVFQLHEVNHNVTQYLQNQFISKMFFFVIIIQFPLPTSVLFYPPPLHSLLLNYTFAGSHCVRASNDQIEDVLSYPKLLGARRIV